MRPPPREIARCVAHVAKDCRPKLPAARFAGLPLPRKKSALRPTPPPWGPAVATPRNRRRTLATL
eukprot:5228275-Alexandrium_andersonii.AAC.1